MSSSAVFDMLDPVDVGEEAKASLLEVQAHPLYGSLRDSSLLYNHCWTTTSGMLLVEGFDIRKDSPPLFEEAMRALALKSAVWRLTKGNQELAELLIAAPVDDMIHAIIAQPNVWLVIRDETDFVFVHMTNLEREGYTPGCFTHAAYLAAWGEEPPSRYWLDQATADRRRGEVDRKLSSIGVHDLGGRSDLVFT